MNSKIKLLRPAAVQIYDLTRMMTGSASYQLLRQQIIKSIEKAWPEILVPDQSTPPEERREIEINSREQRCLADGLLELINRKDPQGRSINVASFEALEQACRTCKVWNWVRSQIAQEEVPEFEGPLDDEPPISDE